MGQILLENSNARFIWVIGGENCPFWAQKRHFWAPEIADFEAVLAF